MITLGRESKFIASLQYEAISVISISIDKDKREVKVSLEVFDNFLKDLEDLASLILNKTDIKPIFVYSYKGSDPIPVIISILKFEQPISRHIFSNYTLKDNIIYTSRLNLDNLRRYNLNERVKELSIFFNTEIHFEESRELVEEREIFNEIIQDDKEEVTIKKVLLGRGFEPKVFSIDKIVNAPLESTVILEGRVFHFRTIRGMHLFNLDLDKDAFGIKFFSKDKIEIDNDDFVQIRGKKELDFSHEIVISAKDIVKIEQKKEMKDRDRVELHLHTKMSEMDSIIDISEAFSLAKKRGYSALGISDGGAIYGFPEAYKAAKKYGIKPILGVEGYVVDDSCFIEDIDALIEEEIVVFDIETTGFNPFKDKVIEIGAVKVKSGNVLEKFQRFADPEQSLSRLTTELTGIRDEMLIGADKIDTVLKMFLDFVGDRKVVAHNANFDMGFIRKVSADYNLSFKNRSVDSLDLSRTILKENKKHSLKDLAKHFGFEFNHHRALEDAQVTVKVLYKLLAIAQEQGLKSLNRDVKATFPDNVLIYPKNRKGLQALYDVISNSHIVNFKRKPKIAKSYLEDKREDLLIGASFNYGQLSSMFMRGDDPSNAARYYDFIEISPIETSSFLGEDYNKLDVQNLISYLVSLGKTLGIPVIATSNVKYIKESEAKFLLPLSLGKEAKKDTKQFFRTSEEMLQAFSFLGEDAEKVIFQNPEELVKQIENIKPVPDGFYPPVIEGAAEEVEALARSAAQMIYGDNEVVRARVDKELNAIIGNGFAVLYLISQKLVKQSLEANYLVGSRGSVGSSLVAWLLNITEVNALDPHYLCTKCKRVEFSPAGSGVDLEVKECCNEEMVRDGHSIPFEVFMGFKGEKIPDIDLNFSSDYQAKAHKHLEDLFGKENVFRAGTISTLAERNAIGYVKKYFEENNISVRRAFLELYASKCENVRKTSGQHPGGMIIVPKDRSILEFTPIQHPANDEDSHVITTHFDYHVMDEQLVKLDLLGHDDPTNLKMLEDLTGIPAKSVPLSDRKVLSIFNSSEVLNTEEYFEVGTLGIPEFGTPFVRRVLLSTKPTTFAELVRISGLSHGIDVWSNNAQHLIEDKVATLSEVISVRDDIMNYLFSKGVKKEIAFEIMEFVRKGLPSRKTDKWEEYVKVMELSDIPDWYIESCAKITYMFPKGHAVAYVLMAVRIAYFKVHHPLAFYASHLTRKVDLFDYEIFMDKDIPKEIDRYMKKSKLDNKEKNELYIFEILLEMKLRGIEILPIDLYKSEATVFKIENGKIRIPFVTLSGLGASAAESIIDERDEKFKSLEDLRKRTKVSKAISEKAKALGLFPDLKDLNQGQLF